MVCVVHGDSAHMWAEHLTHPHRANNTFIMHPSITTHLPNPSNWFRNTLLHNFIKFSFLKITSESKLLLWSNNHLLNDSLFQWNEGFTSISIIQIKLWTHTEKSYKDK